jgi:hypothetical protein
MHVLPRRRAQRPILRRDLVHELVGDRLAEGGEVLDHHEEGALAADHVLPVVFGQALGRLGVREIAGIGVLVDDGEAVDGDAARHRLVARVAHRAPRIVGAVARDVDDHPLGGDAGLAEITPAEIERGADRGAPDKGARRVEQQRREGRRALAVADHCPIGDHLLLLRARPFDEADGDRAILPRGDGAQHARIGDRGGIALALQLELVVVDAARHVGGQDQRHVHLLGAGRGRGAENGGGQGQKREDRPHRHPSLTATPRA